MQITALAVLIVVLFPVVSLTDDLRAYTAPAEVEHLMRRDSQDQTGGHAHTAAAIPAVLLALPHTSRLGTSQGSALSMKIGTPREAYMEVLENRPPPCA